MTCNSNQGISLPKSNWTWKIIDWFWVLIWIMKKGDSNQILNLINRIFPPCVQFESQKSLTWIMVFLIRIIKRLDSSQMLVANFEFWFVILIQIMDLSDSNHMTQIMKKLDWNHKISFSWFLILHSNYSVCWLESYHLIFTRINWYDLSHFWVFSPAHI